MKLQFLQFQEYNKTQPVLLYCLGISSAVLQKSKVYIIGCFCTLIVYMSDQLNSDVYAYRNHVELPYQYGFLDLLFPAVVPKFCVQYRLNLLSSSMSDFTAVASFMQILQY